VVSGGPEYYVSRELLIGKALFIYCPIRFIGCVHVPLTDRIFRFPTSRISRTWVLCAKVRRTPSCRCSKSTDW